MVPDVASQTGVLPKEHVEGLGLELADVILYEDLQAHLIGLVLSKSWTLLSATKLAIMKTTYFIVW